MGPMCSSKTIHLWGDLVKNADLGMKALYINTVKDVRQTASGDEGLSTHCSSYNGQISSIPKIKTERLLSVNVSAFDVIGVDEGNTYPDLELAMLYWVDILGKHVICAGLNGCRDRKKFGGIYRLMPHWDEVVHLYAVCRLCLDWLKSVNFRGSISAAPASFTIMVKDVTSYTGNVDSNSDAGGYDGSDEQELIGGTDTYIPVCRHHYMKYRGKHIIDRVRRELRREKRRQKLEIIRRQRAVLKELNINLLRLNSDIKCKSGGIRKVRCRGENRPPIPLVRFPSVVRKIK